MFVSLRDLGGGADDDGSLQLFCRWIHPLLVIGLILGWEELRRSLQGHYYGRLKRIL